MIKELETDISNLEQTNFVLEERIKLFEESQRKDIVDQYSTQPSHSKTAGQPSVTPKPTVFSSCSYQPTHQACRCCTRHCLQTISVISGLDKSTAPNVVTLTNDLSILSSTVKALQDRLQLGTTSPTLIPTKTTSNSQGTSCSTAEEDQDIPPDIVTPTSLDLNVSDGSVNTIDDNVPGSPSMDDLNSNLLTTQLHQLGQTQNQALQ